MTHFPQLKNFTFWIWILEFGVYSFLENQVLPKLYCHNFVTQVSLFLKLLFWLFYNNRKNLFRKIHCQWPYPLNLKNILIQTNPKYVMIMNDFVRIRKLLPHDWCWLHVGYIWLLYQGPHMTTHSTLYYWQNQ